jgi:hypothetical protein
LVEGTHWLQFWVKQSKQTIFMRKIILIALVLIASANMFVQHNASNKGKTLMIASNKSTSQQTGWPIGVWSAELTHPYWVFSEGGYTVDNASLEGELFFDSFSDQ